MKVATQGYCTTCRVDMDTAYRMLKEAGFEAIDWSIDVQWEDGRPRQCWNRGKIASGEDLSHDCIYDSDMQTVIDHYTPEIETIKKYGLEITQAHSPFYAYSSKNIEFLDYAIEVHKKALKLCQYAGCPRLVIHGFSRGVNDYGIDEKDVHDANMKMYTALIPTALETGVTILLENLFTTFEQKRYAGTCSQADEAVAYIDTLNDLAGKECFGLCFDVGHLNLVRGMIPEYVEKLGLRIKALHISDNDGIADLHLAPYTGTIRWQDLYTSLKKIGYAGDVSFETFKQTAVSRCEDDMVMPSLVFVRQCGDFFRRKILE